MPDSETAAPHRSVLDKLCADEPSFTATGKLEVTSRLLAAVKHGGSSIDDLKAAGKHAGRETPTMWRQR